MIKKLLLDSLINSRRPNNELGLGNHIMECTIIIPVHNGERTVVNTLKSLLAQTEKFGELIIINDGSRDNSKFLITQFLNSKKVRYKIINHRNPLGLARSYNEGIKISGKDYVVTLHQDVILKKNSLRKLVRPFLDSKDNKVVASYHVVNHPWRIWKRYNFWGKVYFARLVGKEFSGLDGKFDCFRKKALLEVGLFDEKTFRTAGEDGDMVFRLKRIGKVVPSEAEIVHLHNIDSNFGLKDIIYKQAQYSEVQGVLLRKGRLLTLKELLKSFFREILVLMLFFPFINILGVILIIVYSFQYSKIIYLREYRDPRCLLVPFLNIFLLLVSFFYSFKGFIYEKQNL